MSTIPQNTLNKLLKRLSYALDPTSVSTGEATNKTIKAAYMVYCATKHGHNMPDDALLENAAAILDYPLTPRIKEKLMWTLRWMRNNIPTVTPNLSIQPKWYEKIEKMEVKYGDQLVQYVSPSIIEAIRRQENEQRKYTAILEKMTNDELQLFEALENGHAETCKDHHYYPLLDVAIERIRLHKKYDVYAGWISTKVFTMIKSVEPTQEERHRLTTLSQKMEAYFYKKQMPESSIDEILRLNIENVVQLWASMTPKEREKATAKASVIKHNRKRGRLPMEERKAIRAAQKEANEQERLKSHAAKEKYKEEHPFCVSHKIRLHLNKRQQTYLINCFGITRFTYNWLVDEWLRLRSEGERPTALDTIKRFNSIVQAEYPWAYKYTHYARTTACKGFENAFARFIKTGDMPQHKKHGLNAGSLHYVVGDRKQPILMDYNPDIEDSKPSKKRQYLFVPGLGYVKMMEKLRFKGLFTSIVVKRESDGHFYAVLRVYIDREEWKRTHRSTGIYIDQPTGIDLGIRDLAILSNGLAIDKHEVDDRLRDRKRELQKAIRQKKEAHPGRTSKKQKRMARELAAVKAKIRRRRDDYQHKVSTVLAYTFKNISMENLNVNDMLRDGNLPPHLVLETALYRFRILMEQKMLMADHNLHFAEKAYPSSSICSQCGHQGPDIKLGQRIFRCEKCGATIDRDLNAAVNLAKLIGLGESKTDSAAKSALAAILTRMGVSTHQVGKVKQVGLQT